MTVYVDEVRLWPHARRPFLNGSCHLYADDVEELHAFASRLGLRRAWFQDHPVEAHYDLTPSKRAKAVALGAVRVSARERAIARHARRGAA